MPVRIITSWVKLGLKLILYRFHKLTFSQWRRYVSDVDADIRVDSLALFKNYRV